MKKINVVSRVSLFSIHVYFAVVLCFGYDRISDLIHIRISLVVIVSLFSKLPWKGDGKGLF